ncbi:alpha/beta hydrolase fold domain-containing protein [Kitasatospora sp. NPDC088548]|uniref:alpha/beta hydrolase fold domain-containing protein n=1 Tax=Kitasatospora sp. NPDC088548 TaxID=3364075 RepID=UPI00382883B3
MSSARGVESGPGRSRPSAASPAGAEDLGGLPPTYLDVGDLDLFRTEDIAYAGRLVRAGVPVELHVYPGGIHASELPAPDADLSARITACRTVALDRALNPQAVPAGRGAGGTSRVG